MITSQNWRGKKNTLKKKPMEVDFECFHTLEGYPPGVEFDLY
jgi:hypothetical protein